MTAFVVKNSMSHGIKKVEAELAMDEKSIFVREEDGLSHYYRKRYWASSYEEAVSKAEKIRTSEIGRLKKRIEYLEKLKF
jgi:hypothetical protein